MLDKLPDFDSIAKKLVKDAQTIAEVEMINFVMGNFEKQGFLDGSLHPWAERKIDETPGKAILNQTSALMDSIHVVSSSTRQVVVGSNEPHAKIHNEGGILNIPVTAKMKKFFWYKYKLAKDLSPTEASMYKAMALTKKTHLTVKMPKRQFMGDSISFRQTIDTKFLKMIENRFKTV